MREHRGIAAAELQRDGMLGGIEVEMARHVAVHQRGRGDHLGVEPRVARDWRRKNRQCRSVQSIMGAAQNRWDDEVIVSRVFLAAQRALAPD